MQIAGTRNVSRSIGQSSKMRLAKPAVEVSVIVPTLNEAENLPRVVPQIAEALGGRRFEIIIVDDNSQDDTLDVCAALAERYPLRLIERPDPRNGLSGAVIRGMEMADGELLVVMDADLQHPPEKIPQLLEEIESDRAQMAIGSRYIPGGDTENDWGVWRWLNSKVATWLSKPVAGGTHDPMSGFFALRRETLEQAKRLSPTGYKIALELLCKCQVQRVAEVPIHFGCRELGQSKLSARQQWRFLVHLGRLYQFKYPRAALVAKLCSYGAIGAVFALGTNPAMAPLLSLWSMVAMAYATRLNRPTLSYGNAGTADREISLRTAADESQSIELAA